MVPFDLRERASRRCGPVDSAIRNRHLQRTPGRCDDRAFHHVLKLTHVPRPGILSEGVYDGVGDFFDALALTFGEPSDEVCDQEWNIVGPFAQRRNPNGEHVEAIEEIRVRGQFTTLDRGDTSSDAFRQASPPAIRLPKGVGTGYVVAYGRYASAGTTPFSAQI